MNKNPVKLFPPKKILVPMDASEASVAAWEEASGLALKFGAQIKALYVQQWLHSAVGIGIDDAYLTAQAHKQALAKLRARLGPEADLSCVTGEINNTILAWGKNSEFDLIVMGTHGKTGFERAVSGSVADTVVRNSSIPVLVTRQAPIRVRAVLAPVNFKPYSMKALFYAAAVADAFKARLTVLYVVCSPCYADADPTEGPKQMFSAAMERMPAALRKSCHPKLKIAFGKPGEQIISAAQEAELVVLSAHRKGFLNDIVLGTTAERVLRHCPKPVWTVPAK